MKRRIATAALLLACGTAMAAPVLDPTGMSYVAGALQTGVGSCLPNPVEQDRIDCQGKLADAMSALQGNGFVILMMKKCEISSPGQCFINNDSSRPGSYVGGTVYFAR